MMEWTVDNREKTLAEVAACFGFDVGVEITADMGGVGCADCGDLERVEFAEDLNQGFLICPKALHGFAKGVGFTAEISICSLSGYIPC